MYTARFSFQDLALDQEGSGYVLRVCLKHAHDSQRKRARDAAADETSHAEAKLAKPSQASQSIKGLTNGFGYPCDGNPVYGTGQVWGTMLAVSLAVAVTIMLRFLSSFAQR